MKYNVQSRAVAIIDERPITILLSREALWKYYDDRKAHIEARRRRELKRKGLLEEE